MILPIAWFRPRAPRGFTLPFTPGRPLLHVHVPKCGGLSVDEFLRQMFPVGAVRRLDHHPARFRENFAGLGRHACYSGHVAYRFRELLPPRATAMTFLREPVDRAVSAFYYLRSLGAAARADQEVPAEVARLFELPLAEFLRADPVAAWKALGNVQTRVFSREPTFYLRDVREETRADLARAKRNLERCEFVGLTDRLGESLRLLCRVCDWPEPDEVPHVNRTAARPATALDAETRGRLEELTALDAELYRFGATLFADRLRDAPPPRLPPAPAAVELTFDGPVPGSGWFERAAGPDGYFCWTGPGAWLEVRLAGSGDLAVAVDVLWALHPGRVSDLTAEVNGRPVPLVRARVGGVDRFEGRLPAAAAADGRYRVALRVPRTFRPADVLPGNPVDRELGVAVSRVALGFAGAAARRGAG